jgi:GH25 family lysozyme M1 (1,4-beta-N-acetylmuramidase)
MQHLLSRHESPELVDRFESHRTSCAACRLATSHRSACPQGIAIHEGLVLEAQQAHRAGSAWHERLELADLPTERSFADFVREAARARELAGVATIEGVDTSIWNGTFPWNEAVAQGLGFGIAKASEGNGYTDPQWGASVAALLAPGPLVGGSYHFGRPDLGNAGVDEAAWYLSRHPAACFSPAVPWIFSLDAESAGGSAAWCYAFLDSVSSRIGYSAWFYSFASWISSRGVQAFTRPLWIAWPNPGDPPNEGWPAITAHQHGTRATSVGQVDADRFLGDVTALLTLAGVSPAPSPDPALLLGGSSMTIAIAARPTGTGAPSPPGVDSFAIAPDGASVTWSGDTPPWTPGSIGTLPALPGLVLRAVLATWVDDDALVVDVLDTTGARHRNIIRPSAGWKAGNWEALPGTALVPAAIGDVGSGPPDDDAPLAARVAHLEGELAAIRDAIK